MKNQAHFKIAIVEDNDFYRKLLKGQIQNYFEGYRGMRSDDLAVKTYTNGSDFLENLTDEVDVVVMDFHLQHGENAIKILHKIRDRSSLKCKVLIISSNPYIDLYYQTAKLGVSDFVYKDVDAPVRCCRIIESMLSDRRKYNA